MKKKKKKELFRRVWGGGAETNKEKYEVKKYIVLWPGWRGAEKGVNKSRLLERRDCKVPSNISYLVQAKNGGTSRKNA